MRWRQALTAHTACVSGITTVKVCSTRFWLDLCLLSFTLWLEFLSRSSPTFPTAATFSLPGSRCGLQWRYSLALCGDTGSWLLPGFFLVLGKADSFSFKYNSFRTFVFFVVQLYLTTAVQFLLTTLVLLLFLFYSALSALTLLVGWQEAGASTPYKRWSKCTMKK